MHYYKLIIIFLLFVLGFPGNKVSGNNQGQSLQIDSVSVTENNHVIIGWTLNADYSEGHYVIYRSTNPYQEQYFRIITIPDLDSLYYIDSLINAAEKSYSYFISAFNVHGETIETSMGHQTILIEDLEFDICKEEITVNWSNYLVTTTSGTIQPRPIPFDSTMVLLSFDDQSYEKKMYASIEDTTITIKPEPIQSGKYCIKIKSFDSENPTHTSTSNAKCINTTILEPPAYADLKKASVIDNELIRLNLYVDNTISDPSYVIYRAETHSPDEFFPIDTIKSDLAEIIYNDYIDVFRFEHRYSFEVLNMCNDSVKTSNTVSSIFLEAIPLAENENELNWNHPEIPQERVIEGYIIMRKSQQDDTFEFLADISPNQNYYNDIFATNNDAGLFQEYTYKIRALITPDNQNDDVIFSNHVKVDRDLEIFIPSAFNPNSNIEKNRFFKPIILNVIPKDYHFAIYNNWGQKVFSVKEYIYNEYEHSEDAWDGKINGSEAPSGVYKYSVSFKTKNGKSHHKRGTVTLIR